MQNGTRTTRCEHWKFARRDVWAHQQCILRWNGNNCHGCPPLHLETFVCQHTSSRDICMPAYKLHQHQRVSSGLSHLIKRVVWARCGRSKSLSRYAAENRWRKRQQTLKKRSLWKSTKGHAMISTRQSFFQNRFWNRRADGIVINKYHRTLYILDFKRSSDRRAAAPE